jgi:3D (Asp-Asp-Asp) domain-containing protein
MLTLSLRLLVVSASAALLVGTGCAVETSTDEIVDEGASEVGADELGAGSTFVSKGTGYYPSNSALEGGFKDMRGAPLRTLQQFLNGDADYVSVAMDKGVVPYGTVISIREFNQKYGRNIIFKVVDTGGAFRGKGTSRMDICTANERASLDPTVNGTLHVTVGGAASGGGGSSSSPGSQCKSKTLGRWVDAEECVQSASDSNWYQCVSGSWRSASSSRGPAGACAESHEL